MTPEPLTSEDWRAPSLPLLRLRGYCVVNVILEVGATPGNINARMVSDSVIVCGLLSARI
jgi:hypothetical protein